MINVLVADDHAVVRKGLMQIINETGDMMVAAEASDGLQVLDLVRTKSFDAVVLDLTMPKKSGLEVVKDLHNERPDLPILVLSMHAEDQYAVRVLRAGAKGYLNKESAPEQLVKAIRVVAAGREYISPQVGEQLATVIRKDAARPLHEQLTDREYQVFILLASGKTVGMIADELFLSVKTVSTHRTHILEKLGAKTNFDLTRYALDAQLIA